MFWCWRIQNHEANVAPIVIPATISVHKQSLSILFYVAGWVINRIAEGKTVSANRRKYFKLFASNNQLSFRDAVKLNLPTEMIDRKEISACCRPSKEFFEFICRVETIFVANFTVKAMQSHVAGNLLEEISKATIVALGPKFTNLCPDALKEDEPKKRDILSFALLKFKRMRGAWFEKAIKGQSSKRYQLLIKAPQEAKLPFNAMPLKLVPLPQKIRNLMV